MLAHFVLNKTGRKKKCFLSKTMWGLVYFLCSGAHPLVILCFLCWCHKLLVRLQKCSLRWSSGGKAEDKPPVAWRFGRGSDISTLHLRWISASAFLHGWGCSLIFAGGSRCRCSWTAGAGSCFRSTIDVFASGRTRFFFCSWLVFQLHKLGQLRRVIPRLN